MSTWTWKQAIWESDLSATTKIVLQALASHLNDFGEPMFPSQERLAMLCSLSERAVITHLQIAEEKGWIEPRTRELKGKRWAAKEYIACWPDGVKDVPRWGEGRSNNGVKDVHSNTPPLTSKITEPSVSPNQSKASKRGPTTAIRLEEFLCNSGGEPPSEWGEWAVGEFCWDFQRISFEWSDFHDYWTSGNAKGGGRKSDWAATWRSHCRRFSSDSRRGRGPGGATGGALTAALRASVANRHGVSRAESGEHGGGAAGTSQPDTAGTRPALAPGELPF